MVADWRNARIHPAQIRIVEDRRTFVLCDETGVPLLMDYSECKKTLRQAMLANNEMLVNVERLVRTREWWNRNFADISPDVPDEGT